MINNFLNDIKGELLEQVTGKVNLDSEKLNDASNIIGNTFKDELLDKFSKGHVGEITGLLSKNGSSSPFATNIINQTAGNLMSKLGLPNSISTSIANIAIPFIINKLGDFASENGKDNDNGISDLLGDLVKGSLKDKLLGGLGKKFGF